MYWYQLKSYWWVNTPFITPSQTTANKYSLKNAKGAIIDYNEILYGADRDIPILRVGTESGSSSIAPTETYGASIMSSFADVSESVSIGTHLYLSKSTSKTCYRVGFPFLIATDTVMSPKPQYLVQIESGFISGKYRFKDLISIFPLLSYCSVLVNFSINGEYYNGFCFAPYKIPWYASSKDSAITTRNSKLFGKSSSSNSHVVNTVNATKIALLKTDGLTNTSTYENLTYITDNFSAYANTVIDFGETPQEVPAVFAEWVDSVCDRVYSNSYAVKNYSGTEVLATLTDAPPMTNAVLATIGNQKTISLTGSNGETYSMRWTSETPEGQIFLGLSTVPNSNRPTLLANTETAVSWVGDLVFYEAYGKYRPPTTVFDINLYQNSAEVNRVDKGQFLVGVGTLSGALREECSMLTPSIVYQSADVPTFNYVYIPIFNRYYFVTSLSSVSKNVWRMELNCDVLMTYKEQIFLLQGVIGRQEIDFNEFLVDDKLPAQKNATVEFLNPLSTTLTPFDTQKGFDDHIYVLTVVG